MPLGGTALELSRVVAIVVICSDSEIFFFLATLIESAFTFLSFFNSSSTQFYELWIHSLAYACVLLPFSTW